MNSKYIRMHAPIPAVEVFKRIAEADGVLIFIPSFNKDLLGTKFTEIFYLEKMDMTEEMVRLRLHCTYFNETMVQGDAQGRKLGFIAQEMGREINTLGSKANDAAIQQLVVLMKDELEKVKEQVLNVL